MVFESRRRIVEIAAAVLLTVVLAALFFVAVRQEQRRTRDTLRLAAVKQVQAGLEHFYLMRHGYPNQTTVALGSAAAACLGEQGFQALEGCQGGVVYLDGIPLGEYTYEASDCPQTTGMCASYAVTFNLEGEVGSLGPGGHAVTPTGFQ